MTAKVSKKNSFSTLSYQVLWLGSGIRPPRTIPLGPIPDDVNVLLTHQPPYGILDEGEYHGQQDYHYGNCHLFAKILDVKPTLHFFGHNHNVYGRTERFGITFSNATIVDEHYDVKEEKYLMYKI